MGVSRVNQTSFHSGELSPLLETRNDLKVYGSGLKKARNCLLRNQGSIERRPGTFFRADLGGQSRLESFIFSGDQEYIFAFQNTALKIYSTAGVLLQTITSQPWDTADLFELTFTQQADTMLVFHEDFMPRIITRTGATTFTSAAFAFDSSVNSEEVYQPYFKFADETITLDINSVTKGDTNVTCTTSADHFSSAHVGSRIRYMGAELDITAYTNATTVTATLKKVPLMELDEDPFATAAGSSTVTVTHVGHGFTTGASVTIAGAESIFDTDGAGISYSNLNGARTITVIDDNHYQFATGSGDAATESVDGGGVRVTVSGHPPTRNWDEQVLSAVNGYPKTGVFHEQRLFMAGVSNIPDLVAGSQTGAFFNFDVGEALDSESIQIQIASDEINEIRHLKSSKVLEILTNTAEFFLKASIGKPLTPTDIQIVRQSLFGCSQKAMPRQYDGGTIYIQNNNKTVREFVFNSSTEEFASAPIALVSSHVVTDAQDTAQVNSLSDRDEQLFFIVNADGSMAVYSAQRLQEVNGWVIWTTGTIESVCCTSQITYVAVKRTINSATVYYLEQFASTSFDIPTDMTVTKTLSASYQPHGSPLTKGTTSSSTGLIADGFTNAPQVGEKFKFAGTGTEYTINAVATTSTTGEYSITLNAAVSTSDNVELRFTYSKTWSGLNSAPDMRGLTVHGTSGSTEGGNINYYGDGTVTSGGVVVLDSVAAAVDIGLDYTFEMETMPADGKIGTSAAASPLTNYPRKIGKAIFNLSATYNLKVNTMDVIVNDVSNLNNADTLTAFTGLKEVHFLGYDNKPYMAITQSAPLPVRILQLTTEIYY